MLERSQRGLAVCLLAIMLVAIACTPPRPVATEVTLPRPAATAAEITPSTTSPLDKSSIPEPVVPPQSSLGLADDLHEDNVVYRAFTAAAIPTAASSDKVPHVEVVIERDGARIAELPTYVLVGATPPPLIAALALRRAAPTRLVVSWVTRTGLSGGTTIWVSNDDGLTWQEKSGPGAREYGLVEPVGPSFWVTVGNYAGPGSYTTDAGASWAVIPVGAEWGRLSGQATPPKTLLGEIVLAYNLHDSMGESAGVAVLHGVDPGIWDQPTTLDLGPGQISVNVVGARFWVVSSRADLRVSRDGGRTWVARTSLLSPPLPEHCVTTMEFASELDATAVVIDYSSNENYKKRSTYFSHDGGRTFRLTG